MRVISHHPVVVEYTFMDTKNIVRSCDRTPNYKNQYNVKYNLSFHIILKINKNY